MRKVKIWHLPKITPHHLESENYGPVLRHLLLVCHHWVPRPAVLWPGRLNGGAVQLAATP
jgi:hypothetical protein